MRWVLAVAVLVVSLIIGLLSPPGGATDDGSTRVVVCTTTRAHLATANPNRLGLTVQTVGTLHVGLSFGGQTGTQSLTLHVGASYSFPEQYLGGVQCQTQPGTGASAVEVFEMTR